MAPLYLLLSTIFFSSLLYLLLSHKKKAQYGQNGLPPGPKGWPIFGNLPQLGPKPHRALTALAKTYGPLFYLRFGSVNVVVAASADVASQFLRAHDANFSNRPPNSGAEHIAYNYQDLIFTPYGPRWRMLRKLCALHLFSQKALDNLRPIREAEVASLAHSLYARAKGHEMVNLGQAMTFCTTNSLSRSMVGLKVFGEEAERGKAAEFKEMVVEMMRLAGVFNLGDFIPVLRPFDLQGVVGKMKRLHKKLDKFLDKVIDDHRGGEGIGGDDLLSVMLRLKDGRDSDGGKLTYTDIKALLLNLFAGGTDTSSSSVEWALSELIRHPDILKQAQTELDSFVGRDRLVSESDLPNLPFLQAIIKETFRLHPPTPLSIPHMAAEDCKINGFHIPKRATLIINIWAISRDPSVWADPLEFRPARFLPGGGYENMDVKGNDFELMPFGAGRRICVGLSLGLRMVQFVTATIVHAFDWTLPEGQFANKLDMEEAYGLTMQRVVPLIVQPVPRLAREAYGTSC